MTDWALENLSAIVHRAVDGFDDKHQGWAKVLGWPADQVAANSGHARALATAAMARNAIADHLSRPTANAAPRLDDAASALRLRASRGPEGADPIGRLPEDQRGMALDFVNRTLAETPPSQHPARSVDAGVAEASIGGRAGPGIPPDVFEAPPPRPHRAAPSAPTVFSPGDWKALQASFFSPDEAALALGDIVGRYKAPNEWTAVLAMDAHGLVHIVGLKTGSSTHDGNVDYDAVPEGMAAIGYWHLHPTPSLTATEFSKTDYDNAFGKQEEGRNSSNPKTYRTFRAYLTDGTSRDKDGKFTTYVLPENLDGYDSIIHNNYVHIANSPRGPRIGRASGPLVDLSKLPDQFLSTPTALQMRVHNASYDTPDNIKDVYVFTGPPVRAVRSPLAGHRLVPAIPPIGPLEPD